MSNELTQKTAGIMLRPEIGIAVDWWADQLLGDAEHDAGDFGINAIMLCDQSDLDKLEKRHVERFRLALFALTSCLCADSWREEEPRWGSANRTLATDYGPDATLDCALRYAGITGGNLRLPIKTCMWINPGIVKVRLGYHGREGVLYPAREAAEAAGGK